MKIRRITGVVFALCFFMPICALASNFDHIVAFGDSLSDNGNLYADDPSACPAETYYQGRFSNGLVWVDYLAEADYLDATLINNAYGGANTGDLIDQVTAYINAGTLDQNALITIWIGGNDFLGGSSDYEQSADNVKIALDSLATFGAESILILNLSDLGAIPAINADTNAAALATLWTENYNVELKDNVDVFKSENPGITVYYLDIYALFQDIVANPANYGLSNVDSICPNSLETNNFDNDDGYLFWDATHPTTEAHEEVAERATSLVSPSSDSDSDDGGGGGCLISTMVVDW